MLWSRLHHGLPPGLRHRPFEDWPPRPARLLTQPYAAGMTGWVVVFGAVIAEVAGGVAVARATSAAIAVPVLIFPVVVVFGFAAVQWWQVYSWGAEPASWWHLVGVVAAGLIWLLWPTVRWPTGALILIAALLARRSRIAAWAAIPTALAGCEIAIYFLR